jgi:hypothetical protein
MYYLALQNFHMWFLTLQNFVKPVQEVFMDTITIVNGTVWIFAIILTSFVIVQAAVFLKKALSFNKKHKLLTEEEVKISMRTGIFSIIGPGFSVMITALTIMAMLGSGAAFMRIGVIGSASYELMLAGIAADVLGIELKSANITTGVFILVLYAMILGSAPYFINCFFSLKPMERSLIKNKSIEGSFAKVVGFIASIALIGYFAIDNLRKGKIEAIVMFISGGVTILLSMYAEKFKKKWIYEWMLAIALIVGLGSSIILTEFIFK